MKKSWNDIVKEQSVNNSGSDVFEVWKFMAETMLEQIDGGADDKGWESVFDKKGNKTYVWVGAEDDPVAENTDDAWDRAMRGI